jgi:prepilin-type N-terminal cleavage/methylation domain-containing protein
MNRISHVRGKVAQAFTLIEMLVVVTIIVLLLAFSTPALMRTMQSSRLASVGDSLMGADFRGTTDGLCTKCASGAALLQLQRGL